MPSDFNAAVQRTLAAIPPVDDYGFTFQQNTAGINGSHRGAPAEAPRRVIPTTFVPDEMEARAGVESLDALQQQRRDLMPRYTALRAIYGPGGTLEARRKAFRCKVANEIAASLAAERGKQPPEAEIERLAAGHPAVRRWLRMATQGAREYADVDEQVTAIQERIENRKAMTYFAGAEARLAA